MECEVVAQMVCQTCIIQWLLTPIENLTNPDYESQELDDDDVGKDNLSAAYGIIHLNVGHSKGTDGLRGFLEWC
jgi:hypothetical protein